MKLLEHNFYEVTSYGSITYFVADFLNLYHFSRFQFNNYLLPLGNNAFQRVLSWLNLLVKMFACKF